MSLFSAQGQVTLSSRASNSKTNSTIRTCPRFLPVLDICKFKNAAIKAEGPVPGQGQICAF